MRKILGKDEETNIFTALSKSNENLGGAIALQNKDNKEYFQSIIHMVQNLELVSQEILYKLTNDDKVDQTLANKLCQNLKVETFSLEKIILE